MEKQIRRWILFSHPGSFMSEQTTKDVKEFDLQLVEWPRSAFCFSCYEREDVIDEDRDKTYVGEAKQIGPTYFHPDSRIMTLEDVKRELPDQEILISNMEGNGYQAVIKCRHGNFQPYDKKLSRVLVV